MNDRDRLAHLRGVLLKLERMPATADRDWMMREVRARIVDIDTGVRPAALRALPQDDVTAEIVPTVIAAPAPAKPKAPRRAPVKIAVPTSPPPLPALRARTGSDDAVDLLQPGWLLSTAEPAPETADTATPRPWTAGLRG